MKKYEITLQLARKIKLKLSNPGLEIYKKHLLPAYEEFIKTKDLVEDFFLTESPEYIQASLVAHYFNNKKSNQRLFNETLKEFRGILIEAFYLEIPEEAFCKSKGTSNLNRRRPKNNWLDFHEEAQKLISLFKEIHEVTKTYQNLWWIHGKGLGFTNTSQQKTDKLASFEKETLARLLERNSRKKVANSLGISERTLYRKIKEYNIM